MGVFDKFLDIMKLNEDDYDDQYDEYDEGGFYDDDEYEEKPRHSFFGKKNNRVWKNISIIRHIFKKYKIDIAETWGRVYGNCNCSEKSGTGKHQIRDFRFSVSLYGAYGGKRHYLGRDCQ